MGPLPVTHALVGMTGPFVVRTLIRDQWTVIATTKSGARAARILRLLANARDHRMSQVVRPLGAAHDPDGFQVVLRIPAHRPPPAPLPPAGPPLSASSPALRPARGRGSGAGAVLAALSRPSVLTLAEQSNWLPAEEEPLAPALPALPAAPLWVGEDLGTRVLGLLYARPGHRVLDEIGTRMTDEAEPASFDGAQPQGLPGLATVSLQVTPRRGGGRPILSALDARSLPLRDPSAAAEGFDALDQALTAALGWDGRVAAREVPDGAGFWQSLRPEGAGGQVFTLWTDGQASVFLRLVAAGAASGHLRLLYEPGPGAVLAAE